MKTFPFILVSSLVCSLPLLLAQALSERDRYLGVGGSDPKYQFGDNGGGAGYSYVFQGTKYTGQTYIKTRQYNDLKSFSLSMWMQNLNPMR
jgi:hypothetical protein